ncbi:MAG: hypothetical protein MZV70_00280 [Desulfobacterales bacterium]|nr:hypothetical protein [Desulfobacterales bacterium]
MTQLINRLAYATFAMSARRPEWRITGRGRQRHREHDDPRTTSSACPLGRVSPYWMILPPGYHTEAYATTRHPVVFFLHGYGQDPQDMVTSAIIFQELDDPAVAPRGPADAEADHGLPGRALPRARRARRTTSGSASAGTFYADSIRPEGPQAETILFERMDYIDDNYRTKAATDVTETWQPPGAVADDHDHVEDARAGQAASGTSVVPSNGQVRVPRSQTGRKSAAAPGVQQIWSCGPQTDSMTQQTDRGARGAVGRGEPAVDHQAAADGGADSAGWRRSSPLAVARAGGGRRRGSSSKTQPSAPAGIVSVVQNIEAVQIPSAAWHWLSTLPSGPVSAGASGSASVASGVGGVVLSGVGSGTSSASVASSGSVVSSGLDVVQLAGVVEAGPLVGRKLGDVGVAGVSPPPSSVAGSPASSAGESPDEQASVPERQQHRDQPAGFGPWSTSVRGSS